MSNRIERYSGAGVPAGEDHRSISAVLAQLKGRLDGTEGVGLEAGETISRPLHVLVHDTQKKVVGKRFGERSRVKNVG